MSEQEKQPALSPCQTCPWRTRNQQEKPMHPWYKASNLKRLWNGLRTGRSPGMICHSTDPDAPFYGGKAVNAGHERECAGALILLSREIDALEKHEHLKDYQAARLRPLTKTGLGVLVEKILFRPRPIVLNMQEADAIALPFEQEKSC